MYEAPANFEELRSKRHAVSELCSWHFSALELFHLRRQKFIEPAGTKIKILGFYNLLPPPGTVDPHVSITCTATCIKSLAKCHDFSQADPDYSSLLDDLLQRHNDNSLTTKGLPPGNAYTVGLLLPLLHVMKAPRGGPVVQRCIGWARECVLEGGARIRDYPASGYLTYWILKGLYQWGENVTDYNKALDWSKQEFYRQVSLFAAKADEDSDAFQLGYNLLVQYTYRRDDVRETVIGLALRTLFDAQLQSGLWEKKDPLFVYPQTGDAYCFSFELLTALLTDLADGNDTAAMDGHDVSLNKALQWAQRNKAIHDDIPV